LKKVGITTTIPVEVIFAAGMVPVDLNNVFVGGGDPGELVERAENAGFPRNTCSWTKGIYATAQGRDDIETIVAVAQGDCSNTQALRENLRVAGREIVSFSYPYPKNRDTLRLEIERLMTHFEVDWPSVLEVKARLDRIRLLVLKLDQLTWEQGSVSGWENHYYQVSFSDFNGDYERFGREIAEVVRAREADAALLPSTSGSFLRLGYIGVPPLISDFYDFVESLGARVVFNEVQRQFVMPQVRSLVRHGKTATLDDLVQQYLDYTYPYDVFERIKDIKAEAARRNLVGLVHYTQSFCFHQIEDRVLREELPWPILTLEADRPGRLDARSKMRIESFIEMLKG